MNPEMLLERMWQERAVAIIRTGDHDVARDAMSAAVEGGFRLVEFTLHCPRPFELIESFAKQEGFRAVLRRGHGVDSRVRVSGCRPA